MRCCFCRRRRKDDNQDDDDDGDDGLRQGVVVEGSAVADAIASAAAVTTKDAPVHDNVSLESGPVRADAAVVVAVVVRDLVSRESGMDDKGINNAIDDARVAPPTSQAEPDACPGDEVSLSPLLSSSSLSSSSSRDLADNDDKDDSYAHDPIVISAAGDLQSGVDCLGDTNARTDSRRRDRFVDEETSERLAGDVVPATVADATTRGVPNASGDDHDDNDNDDDVDNDDNNKHAIVVVGEKGRDHSRFVANCLEPGWSKGGMDGALVVSTRDGGRGNCDRGTMSPTTPSSSSSLEGRDIDPDDNRGTNAILAKPTNGRDISNSLDDGADPQSTFGNGHYCLVGTSAANGKGRCDDDTEDDDGGGGGGEMISKGLGSIRVDEKSGSDGADGVCARVPTPVAENVQSDDGPDNEDDDDDDDDDDVDAENDRELRSLVVYSTGRRVVGAVPSAADDDNDNDEHDDDDDDDESGNSTRSGCTGPLESSPSNDDDHDGEVGDERSSTASSTSAAARDRYDKACSLLRRSLLRRDESLTQSERDFLVDLLTAVSGTSSMHLPSDDEFAEIESASVVLRSDPLFETRASPEVAGEREGEREEEEREERDDTVSTSMEAARNNISDATAHFRRRYKKNRVELCVLEGDEIEVSRLHTNDSCSTRSVASSVQTVTDLGFVLDLSRISNCDEEQQPNKKVKLDPDALRLIARFDGWAIAQQECRPMDDGDDDGGGGGGGESIPFVILGTSANDDRSKPHVMSPLVMEAMRGFLPFVVSEENFWMKFSSVRDGASLQTLLQKVRASRWTVIAVETVEGDVFGSFTGSPWREQHGYFGHGEAFLWRLRKSRWASQVRLAADAANSTYVDGEMEVFPNTGFDSLLQLCTSDYLAVGGGPWKFGESQYGRNQLGVGLRIESDLLSGESKSCGTFANPPLCKSCEDGSMFEIMNLEVWTLTPCLSKEEAEKMEEKKLFVEEHRRK